MCDKRNNGKYGGDYVVVSWYVFAAEKKELFLWQKAEFGEIAC